MDSRVYSLLMLSLIVSISCHVHTAVETEMFSIPISPNIFNWTYQEFNQQYRFHTSLLDKPELPSWLRYIYSSRHHSGFIFGTPPRGTKSPLTLEVIGLNRQDYEIRRLLLTLEVQPKNQMALHEVEMKIDNLNVEDLLDQHKMEQLKDIFRIKLWTESTADLYTTFLSSAIDLGARLPLKPNDGEGLVVRLGSTTPFSNELHRLREEVRPLSRLVNCPREYKRTTVERLFRDATFTLDWCNFELYNTIYKERKTELVEYLSESADRTDDQDRVGSKMKNKILRDESIWTAPSKNDLPVRSYLREFTVAIIVPVFLMMISMIALTAVLCFHYVGIVHKSERVEICRYGTGNTEQTQIADNASAKSTGVSPNNSMARPYSPKSTTNLAGNYNRPQPPPYISSNANSLHNRKSGTTEKTTPSTSGHTPELNRGHMALEESLQLLNEANILSVDYIDAVNIPVLKDPVIDLTDGGEDYVPIKPDGSFMKLEGYDLGLNGLGSSAVI